MVYKVVETGTVTDEALEQILNRWTAEGLALRRPAFRHERGEPATGDGFCFLHPRRPGRRQLTAQDQSSRSSSSWKVMVRFGSEEGVAPQCSQ